MQQQRQVVLEGYNSACTEKMEGVAADWWPEGWRAVGGGDEVVTRMEEDGRKGDGHVVEEAGGWRE